MIGGKGRVLQWEAAMTCEEASWKTMVKALDNEDEGFIVD